MSSPTERFDALLKAMASGEAPSEEAKRKAAKDRPDEKSGDSRR